MPQRRVIINMLSLPSQRYRRQATKDVLDLVGNFDFLLSLVFASLCRSFFNQQLILAAFWAYFSVLAY